MDELFDCISGEHWFDFGDISNFYVAGLNKAFKVLIKVELLVKNDSQVPTDLTVSC